jgi:predicted Fe-Mo cluster-binding NifX family protein
MRYVVTRFAESANFALRTAANIRIEATDSPENEESQAQGLALAAIFRGSGLVVVVVRQLRLFSA